MTHVIILDLNIFKTRKRKKMYDYTGNQFFRFNQEKHKIVIYPHYLTLLQYF